MEPEDLTNRRWMRAVQFMEIALEGIRLANSGLARSPHLVGQVSSCPGGACRFGDSADGKIARPKHTSRGTDQRGHWNRATLVTPTVRVSATNVRQR